SPPLDRVPKRAPGEIEEHQGGQTMPTKAASGASAITKPALALRDALQRAKSELHDAKPNIGFVFCSPDLSLSDALQEARHSLPEVEWLGCTTAGEITERGITHGGLAMMLLSTTDVRYAVDWSQRMSAPDVAAKELTRRLGEARRAGGMGTTVLLVDGLSGTG